MSSSRRGFLGASALSFLAALSPFRQSQAESPKSFPLLNAKDWPGLTETPAGFLAAKLQRCRVAIRGRTGFLTAARANIFYPKDGMTSSLFPCEIHLQQVMASVPVTRSFLQTMGDIGHGRELIVYIDGHSTQGYSFKRPILVETEPVSVFDADRILGSDTVTAAELIDAYGENAGRPIKLDIEDRVSITQSMLLMCVEAPELTTADENEFILHSSPVRSKPRPRLDEQPMTPEQRKEYDAQVINGANSNVDLSVWGAAGINLQDPTTYPDLNKRKRDRHNW